MLRLSAMQVNIIAVVQVDHLVRLSDQVCRMVAQIAYQMVLDSVAHSACR